MKPTLPEDHAIEEQGGEVSRRYREIAADEPSARVDAAILEAARHEAERPAAVRNWRVPAAVAAVLVIGVSVSLLTREGIDPLPPLDPTRRQAEVAKPASPSLAMKPETAAKRKFDMESRPPRERGERADRESETRPGTEAFQSEPADVARSSEAQVSAPAPLPLTQPEAPAVAAPAQAPASAEKPSAAGSVAEARPNENASGARVLRETPAAEEKSVADAPDGRATPLRKEHAAAPAAPAAQSAPETWLRHIEDMIRNGKQVEARVQLAEFHKRYPAYRLPEFLQAFEREAPQAPK